MFVLFIFQCWLNLKLHSSVCDVSEWQNEWQFGLPNVPGLTCSISRKGWGKTLELCHGPILSFPPASASMQLHAISSRGAEWEALETSVGLPPYSGPCTSDFAGQSPRRETESWIGLSPKSFTVSFVLCPWMADLWHLAMNSGVEGELLCWSQKIL